MEGLLQSTESLAEKGSKSEKEVRAVGRGLLVHIHATFLALARWKMVLLAEVLPLTKKFTGLRSASEIFSGQPSYWHLVVPPIIHTSGLNLCEQSSTWHPSRVTHVLLFFRDVQVIVTPFSPLLSASLRPLLIDLWCGHPLPMTRFSPFSNALLRHSSNKPEIDEGIFFPHLINFLLSSWFHPLVSPTENEEAEQHNWNGPGYSHQITMIGAVSI